MTNFRFDEYIVLYFNDLAGQWEGATPSFLRSRLEAEKIYDQLLAEGFSPRDLRIVHTL